MFRSAQLPVVSYGGNLVDTTTPLTATFRLDDTLTVTTRRPATVAAGRIALPKTRIVAGQAEQLLAEHAAEVEA
ncbi:MAG: hypothetical protein JO115_15430 [Pseudonocardiales bacterium]|nr:hypothetical protein [Pseudonocardiales bacterium]